MHRHSILNVDSVRKYKYFRLLNGDTVYIDEQFSKVCGMFREAEGEIKVNIEKEDLELIKEFYTRHEFNDNNIKLELPLKTDDIRQELDEISYDVMKDYCGLQNMDKLLPILQTADDLELEGLKKVCIACMTYEFSIGPTQADLDQLIQKNLHLSINKNSKNIQLRPGDEKLYQMEFEQIYEQMNKERNDEMQEKYRELEMGQNRR